MGVGDREGKGGGGEGEGEGGWNGSKSLRGAGWGHRELHFALAAVDAVVLGACEVVRPRFSKCEPEASIHPCACIRHLVCLLQIARFVVLLVLQQNNAVPVVLWSFGCFILEYCIPNIPKIQRFFSYSSIHFWYLKVSPRGLMFLIITFLYLPIFLYRLVTLWTQSKPRKAHELIEFPNI